MVRFSTSGARTRNRRNYPSINPSLSTHIIVSEVLDYCLNVNIYELMAARLREGFSMHQILCDNEKACLRLVLPWDKDIHLTYIIKVKREQFDSNLRYPIARVGMEEAKAMTSSRNYEQLSRTRKEKIGILPPRTRGNLPESTESNFSTRNRNPSTRRHSHKSETDVDSPSKPRRNSHGQISESEDSERNSGGTGNVVVRVRLSSSSDFLQAFCKVSSIRLSERKHLGNSKPLNLHRLINSIQECDRVLTHLESIKNHLTTALSMNVHLNNSKEKRHDLVEKINAGINTETDTYGVTAVDGLSTLR